MKRLFLIALLASVMVFAFASHAFAVDYKLTISTYFDANANAQWDECEPFLPGVIGTANAKDWTTDCCGWVKLWFPYGTVVEARPWNLTEATWAKYFPGRLAWISEATPMKSEAEFYWAKVKMCGNRCMLFGISPKYWEPPSYDCVTPPCDPAPPCEVKCDPCPTCPCPPHTCACKGTCTCKK